MQPRIGLAEIAGAHLLDRLNEGVGRRLGPFAQYAGARKEETSCTSEWA